MADGDERVGMRRRSGRPGDRQLRERAVRTGAPAALPLVHASSVFGANEILRDGRLATKRCTVFDREMIYFFVLRPDYRSRQGSAKSDQISRFPAVFIMRPEVADPPLHVYPFDTGAAHGGNFSEQADPLVYLDDYELDPTLAAAVGHIEWAFGSTQAYWDGRVRRDILSDVPQFEMVTRGYVNVATMGRPGSNRRDRRASAVEVAVGRDVDLKDNVLIAILPKQFLEDEIGTNAQVMARLADLGVPVETYDWRLNTTPDEFQDAISDVARAFFTAGGWL